RPPPLRFRVLDVTAIRMRSKLLHQQAGTLWRWHSTLRLPPVAWTLRDYDTQSELAPSDAQNNPRRIRIEDAERAATAFRRSMWRGSEFLTVLLRRSASSTDSTSIVSDLIENSYA
ncbi:MAG: hypothetical protein ACI8P0_006315, partial [Planctomycetaceae bacterium]